MSLGSFVPEDQAAKIAMIQDAGLLLDVAINPFDLAAPPTDADQVAALTATAAKLKAAATGNSRSAPDARKLAASFERLASATPAQRAAVDAMLAKPLGVMLDQLRLSIQAEPVTLNIA